MHTRSLLILALVLLAPTALGAPGDRYRFAPREVDEGYSEALRKRAHETRQDSIAMLEELVATTGSGERRADMLLRLADLYFQEGRYYKLGEVALCDAEWEACQADPACEDYDPTRCDHTESTRWAERSVRVYEQVIQAYPRSERADDAHWYLGVALADLGRRDEANEILTSLVRAWPESEWAVSAWLQIGEYHFDGDDVVPALRAFERASGDMDEPTWGYARYKLAWCLYNVGQFDRALDEMKRVVAWSTPPEGQEAAQASLQLQEEALVDMVRFFADAGRVEDMIRYFEKLGREDLLRNSMERLAHALVENGKPEEAIHTWKMLIARDPMDRANPSHQHEIARTLREIGRRDQALREVQRLRSDYGPGSSWHRHNQVRPEVLDVAVGYLEKDLRQLAVGSQERCRRMGKLGTDECRVAEAAYASYLDEFADGPRTYEVRYAYGELLYDMSRFTEAWSQYDAVVRMDPKGSHSRFCAESAIHAADAVVKAEGPVAPGEVSHWQGRLVASCDLYADHWPEDDRARTALYKAAWVLYHQRHMEAAAQRFRRVIAMDPASREAEQAAHLILDSFVVDGDWDNLVVNARFFYEQEGLGSPAFKEEVHAILERARFQAVEGRFAADGDALAAAEGLNRFVADFPDSEVADMAVHNAAVRFFDAGEGARADEARRVLVEDPRFGPGNAYYFDAAAALGFSLEQRADFAGAAGLYEAVFEAWPAHRETLDDEDRIAAADTRAADALWSAAWFRRSLEEPEVALAHYQAFAAAWPDDERAGEGVVAVVALHEEAERWVEAADAARSLLLRDGEPLERRMHAHLRRGHDLAAADRADEALAAWAEGVVEYEAEEREPGAATAFYAEARTELLRPDLEAYLAMEVVGAPGASPAVQNRTLERSIMAKAAALEALEADLLAVHAVGVADTGLSALVTMGRAYEDMGAAVLASPIPDFLTPEQAEVYRLRLADMAWIQDEKAATYFATALEGARDAGLYSHPDAVHALERLRELRPGEYPHLFEALPEGHPLLAEEPLPDFETDLD